MSLKACLNCNSFFNSRRNSHVYCCRSCQVTHLKLSGKIKNRPRLGITVKCEHCQKDFYVPQYRAKTARFCSRRCNALGNPENTQKAQEQSPIIKRSRARVNNPAGRMYKRIKIDGRWVREHRWLMEQHLGRKLESWEHVHHIDGNHLNNCIDNLEVLSNADHQRKELEKWKN